MAARQFGAPGDLRVSPSGPTCKRSRFPLDEVLGDSGAHRQRVVQRHARLAVCRLGAKGARRERGDPFAEWPRGRRERCHQPVTGEDDLAGGVEGNEIDRQPCPEHMRCRFRIDVHVELRRRRDITRNVHRAPHDHEPADSAHGLRIGLEGQGNIGEGPQRNDGQGRSVVPGDPDHQFDGADGRGSDGRHRPGTGIAETVLPVVMRRRHPRPRKGR